MTYLTIQTRVKRRVIDLPAAVLAEVPDLINEAIRDLQDLHNFYVMQTLATATTAEDTRALLAKPADFKAFRGHPYYTSLLGVVTEFTIAPNRNAAEKAFGTVDTGAPIVLLDAEEDDDGTSNIEVFPLPNALSDYSDGHWRVTIPYWRYLPALSADSDTNWFTENALHWIIDKATSEAFAVNWNESRADYWENKAVGRLAQVLKRDKYRRLSGVGTFVPHRGAREAKIRKL